MEDIKQVPLTIYTEMTPNPGSLKFVVNKFLLKDISADFKDEKSAQVSPLAAELFTYPYVNGVFIAQNFVTVSKEGDTEWHDVIPTLKEHIKNYVESGKPIISDDAVKSLQEKQAEKTQSAGSDDEIVVKIKDMLKTYIQPAVEMDGGHIAFKKYEDGVVTVSLQGSCSGCPSSTVTLKAGIEGMLKRMIPEVSEVVADMD